MRVNILHETDLFHPYSDPDDHWDLACQYAMDLLGWTHLTGILIDNLDNNEYGDPAIAAVLQMNALSNRAVPVGIGQPNGKLSADIGGGLAMLLAVLERADSPVVINIGGSCADIALAAELHPELFAQKVARIYLNAGAAMHAESLEYNVSIHPEAYAKIFRLPCPIYWMPCFHDMKKIDQVGRYGAYYSFFQGELFNVMSDRLKNYFLYMLTRSNDMQWRKVLYRPVDMAALQTFAKQLRNMWCTAGMIHASGQTVLKNGHIEHLSTVNEEPVFSFVPIHMQCAENGVTHWTPAKQETGRFILQVNDEVRYPSAMTDALKELLSTRF